MHFYSGIDSDIGYKMINEAVCLVKFLTIILLDSPQGIIWPYQFISTVIKLWRCKVGNNKDITISAAANLNVNIIGLNL